MGYIVLQHETIDLFWEKTFSLVTFCISAVWSFFFFYKENLNNKDFDNNEDISFLSKKVKINCYAST